MLSYFTGSAMDPNLTKLKKNLVVSSVNSVINLPLAHIYSIFFWSSEQKKIFDSLGKDIFSLCQRAFFYLCNV